MENGSQMISDLKELIDVVNESGERYELASEITTTGELKALFEQFAAAREGYALGLKTYILKQQGVVKENGSILEVLHNTWNVLKQVFSDKDDIAMLDVIETDEKTMLKKYEKVMEDYVTYADLHELLENQRNAILNALKAIETIHLNLEK